VLPTVPLYSGCEKSYYFPVFLRFVKKRGCFKAREEFWNSLTLRNFFKNSGAFFASQKTQACRGFGRKSASRIYFWSFAYGKTPHWIQAWSLCRAQTPEANP
jgi:hypothetical protein